MTTNPKHVLLLALVAITGYLSVHFLKEISHDTDISSNAVKPSLLTPSEDLSSKPSLLPADDHKTASGADEIPSNHNLLNQSQATEQQPTSPVDDEAPTRFHADDFQSFMNATEPNEALRLLLVKQDATSVAHELTLDSQFQQWQQQHRMHQLSLQTARCSTEVCFVSIAGVEGLSEQQFSQLETELLFNKTHGFAQVAAAQAGGSYGIFTQDSQQFLRVVIATHPKYSGQGVQSTPISK